MKECEGFPQIGCENEATNDLLGYQLCDTCADNWRAAPTREDEHTGAIIVSLREQNLYLYDAIGSALACLRGDSLDMAIGLLEIAMGGKPMSTAPDPPPPPEPEDNPDKESKPGDEGPSPL